ncbi:regulation of nuclear pre-mRNA domain-containing protein 2 [Fundulus heteroclitus]|uniref:regulation of nuclear pre-mRNA domain-containing protein 2 n=1 Tax=Fundulus heteroclitus TaxID=8078 RepID=UPI00165AB567|nr:regulation of nuclear pre-mRNA domain-containing protein 2 [Fundulus heteroclitus]
MAAGSGAASGQAARSSTASLEATLDRRFQGVSNTMESIQSLSAWCIENKKHHGLIVRYWMKWLKKSDHNHRLNLFYLANDVIQNCKRKNAIVFRSAFSDVLPNAALLIKDGKVRKSVERIFTIWEERNVYPEEVISQFKAGLHKKEKEREKQKEKEKEKEKEKQKEKETPSANAPSSTKAASTKAPSTKAALKSKIVAEFTPHSLIEQLTRYQQAAAEEQIREKRLETLRVDVCSSEAFKRLKDKAGGNKFAKDFEEGSLKLEEFVGFLEKELKTGPPLLEALGNADIFYEMQYKEVKIVANAYNAFANRVNGLKKKLDSLKATLSGPEDSPIPSPSEDAPSPTGSDSPFLEMETSRAKVDPELDGKAMDDGEPQNDNRDMEDMDMSDEEASTVAASQDGKEDEESTAVSKTKSDAASKPPSTPTRPSKASPSAVTTAAPVTPTSAKATAAPTAPLGVNLAKVDLGKISSILNSLTSAMKHTAPTPSPRPSPGTPTTPTGQSAASKGTPPSPALASILSRVDITPEGILNALSKTNTQGLSSLLQSVTHTSSAPTNRTSPDSSGVKTPVTPTTPKTKPVLGNSLKQDEPGRPRDWEKERQLSPPPPPPPPRTSAPSVSPPSLESKINSFLQGNPGFSLALGDASPDGVDGTPVRDEAAGTPTQDEIMDTPGAGPESLGSSGGHNLSPTAYRNDPWDAAVATSGSNKDGDFHGSSSSSRFGAGKKSSGKVNDEGATRKQVSSSPGNDLKGRNSRAAGERRPSAGTRRASTGSDDGGLGGKKDNGKELPAADAKEGRYHRIETLVSPHTEGAPIQTVGYSNRPPAGERIKTVESIRVIGRGSRRGGGAGNRPGASMWFEEEEYMEGQPPSPRVMPPPINMGQGGAEDMNPSMLPPPPPPPPPPHHVPHLHPPPSLPLPPQTRFPMPYLTENMQTPPPSLLQPHLHPSSPFFTAAPPIPRLPPPPSLHGISPPPPPPRPALPHSVMVGGMLVPVDHALSLPPSVRPEGAERGRMGPRGRKVTPPPLMSSLLGEPPKLPRPGTVKEPLIPRHTPPLHRPGTPGVPPPLLGRVKEPLILPLPSPTSSTPSPSTPNSPAGDSALSKPPTSPPAQTHKPSANPVPLLNLPAPRTPILPTPMQQRPPLRGRSPSQDHPRGAFHGGKRAGPPFRGGPFHAQKRPYLPPRY